MGLSVHSTGVQGESVIAVAGEVDVHTAPELRSTLTQAARTGHRRLVVDLTDLDFIDSTGLGVLVAARQQALDHGTDFRLVCPAHRRLKVFRLTGLDAVFDIRFTPPEAVPAEPATHRADDGPTPSPVERVTSHADGRESGLGPRPSSPSGRGHSAPTSRV